MVGTSGTEFDDKEQLTTVVYEELIALRGAYGKLTVEKFSKYPALRLVCGGGDVLDAFLKFERELQRYVRQGGRNEAAAALSITAEQDTVLARFEEVLGHFEEPGGPERNQRTARRWSDQGMHTIASELVHLSDVQQRLGSELVTIELSGTYEGGVSMVIWQLTTRHREERSPLIRIWKYRSEADAEHAQDITYDLDLVESPEATKGPFRVRRFDFSIGVPTRLTLASVQAGSVIYRFSIEGRDAPLRAISFQDDSDLGKVFSIRFTAYLTDAMIEVVKSS